MNQQIQALKSENQSYRNLSDKRLQDVMELRKRIFEIEQKKYMAKDIIEMEISQRLRKSMQID